MACSDSGSDLVCELAAVRATESLSHSRFLLITVLFCLLVQVCLVTGQSHCHTHDSCHWNFCLLVQVCLVTGQSYTHSRFLSLEFLLVGAGVSCDGWRFGHRCCDLPAVRS
jgi:hypothetical protein